MCPDSASEGESGWKRLLPNSVFIERLGRSAKYDGVYRFAAQAGARAGALAEGVFCGSKANRAA